MRVYFLLLLYLGLTQSLAAQTTPKPPSTGRSGSDKATEEAVILESVVTRVHFENDGTGFREITTAIRAQSYAGVEAFGQLVFGYSSATEKLEVNYVRVKKASGEIIETPGANSQDFAPETLRSAPMYSDYRQRHVTVSALRPGDLLEYRVTTRTETALVPGEFWFEYSFPENVQVNEARLEIDVPKARELRLKSPRRKYTTADNGDRRVYSWVVQNITPKHDKKSEADDEEDQEESEAEKGPEIQLTTFKDWQQIAQWYAKLQSERVVVDDAVRKKAADLTRNAANNQEKARRLYDFVAKDIRYVSLSFGIGRFQPHAAPEVLQGFYGDCKDKHTLLAALLKAVGITSYPVLIGSDHKLDEEIPSPAQFDHVITAAQIDKDLVWLDSTEEVAPYGMIMYSLRDKQAVLAASDSIGGLRKTPALSPVRDSLLLALDGKFSEKGGLDATVDIVANGDTAMPLRMTFRRIPQTEWKKMAEGLAFFQGLRGDVSDLDVAALDDITQPLHIKFKLHQESYFTVPLFNEPLLFFPPLGFTRLPKKQSNEPLDIGPVREVRQKAHLQFPANYTITIPPEVRISRDYGEYSSGFRLANNILDAERVLVLKTNQLPATRRPDVESLRSVVFDRTGQTVSCTIRPAAKAAEATTAPSGSSTRELHQAGLKALRDRDFKNAAELLKRTVEQEPQSKEAWDELGLAYVGLNNHGEALTAFQKQVEVNQFHKRAYDDLGAELRSAGKYEEALNAYTKQLENLPLDRVARKNRGLLLLQLKHEKEAVTELEAANAVPPEDPEIELALAQAYTLIGNPDKSRPLLTNVIGSTTPVSNGDIYATALRDDVDAGQALHTATQIVNGIGDQFDENVYGPDTPETFIAMHFLALEWARMGWAKFRQGQALEGIRFLNSAWILSQSGTVANRLARVYLKAGQADKARDLFTLAAAAGGADVENSRAQLQKLDSVHAEAKIAQAKAELVQMRTVKLPELNLKKGQAEFTLVFDGSSKPELVEFYSGDADLVSARQALTDAAYPVTFPDNSSAKIVRRGVLACSASGCAVTLKPLESVTAIPGVQALAAK